MRWKNQNQVLIFRAFRIVNSDLYSKCTFRKYLNKLAKTENKTKTASAYCLDTVSRWQYRKGNTNGIQWPHWTYILEAKLTRFCMAVYQMEGSCMGRKQGTTEGVLTSVWLSKDLNIVRNNDLKQGKIQRKRVLRAHTCLGILHLFPRQNGKNV